MFESVDLSTLGQVIGDLGFPIVAVVGLVYFVHYVWLFTTRSLRPKIDEQRESLIALDDTVRDLETDLIRLQEKIEVIREVRENK